MSFWHPSPGVARSSLSEVPVPGSARLSSRHAQGVHDLSRRRGTSHRCRRARCNCGARKPPLRGHTGASQELAFTVRGHPVEPSDTLVIRNFRFYRGEQDTEPLQKAAYRPGDPVWARFDITGFKYGEDHAIQVSYGVAVISPSGKELWSQAEAAVEKSQSFYPKRYVPGIMSLNLQPNIRPGEYGMVITVHDQIGNQKYEARQNFDIE